MRHFLLALFILLASALCAQPAPDTLIFQTSQPWSPSTNLNAGTVLVYGIDDSLPTRIASWRHHGYHTAVMTGVAWGRYAPYLRGDFDGHTHWDETQQAEDGSLILHDGREVPYIAPSASYGKYLAAGILRALDAGAEAVYLEEPEFWARAGWSPSFQRSWMEHYNQPWSAPSSSPDAQYRASELKYRLYRDALAQVFAAVRAYGEQHGRIIPCYVATHSLINYAQWQIVSPESSLLAVGADGYIAQVWTGTARTPNTYDGETRERTFAAAFLEYGALQNIARSSGKKIWYLNDPIEDNPNHSWSDYRSNWESTLVASLLQPEVSRYEVVPWPERIFSPGSLYPATEPTSSQPTPLRVAIPAAYATELQSVFYALGQLQQQKDVRWLSAGSEDIGVLVSDTMMFERAQPSPSDDRLGNFFGLALPPLLHGIPVEPVQMENTYALDHRIDLARYKILLLTYEGQKPPAPDFHTALAAWVRQGGQLIVVDDDRDPYNKVGSWWSSKSTGNNTPRAALFAALALDPAHEGLVRVGKGSVNFLHQAPSALTRNPAGSKEILQLIAASAHNAGSSIKTSSTLILRRGPYVIAAGLDDSSAQPTVLAGRFINLFDPAASIHHGLRIEAQSRALLVDLDMIARQKQMCIVSASGTVAGEELSAHTLSFKTSGIEGSTAQLRIYSPRAVQTVLLNGHSIPFHTEEDTVTFSFVQSATPQQITVQQ